MWDHGILLSLSASPSIQSRECIWIGYLGTNFQVTGVVISGCGINISMQAINLIPETGCEPNFVCSPLEKEVGAKL